MSTRRDTGQEADAPDVRFIHPLEERGVAVMGLHTRGAWALLIISGLLLPFLALAAPQTVRVNGVDIAYTESGNGEPLVLIHGYGDCGDAWAHFLPALSKRYRVISMELRGHGRSGDFDGPFLFEQSAGDLLGLLDHLGLRTVRAMGISGGGMTLLHAAVREPERIEAMVVIGAAHHFPEQARRIMRGAPDNVPPPVLEFFKACASRGQPQVDGLLQRFNELQHNDADIRLSPQELAAIRARTLIVHGDRDEFFPVAIPVEMYTSIPNSQLWIVPGGDHVPIFDHNARAFEEVTLRFLAEGGR
jgi:pimeloyl-ACP methyl ester carboxylesterase